MVPIRIPDEYSYFWDIVRCIKNGEKLLVDEINLVGGRKSAKTTTKQLIDAFIAMLGLDYVGFASFRNEVQDSEELLNDYCETFDAYEIPYKLNKSKKIIQIANSKIRVFGLNNNRKGNKAKKSGMTKFGNVKYIIAFFEERFEFSETDVQAAKEAMRSINPDNTNVQVLIVNACNPWAKSSPYIQYCGKYQTWDINKLKTTGSQIGFYNIDIGEGKVKRTIFHYTNWRVAKNYLSESEINQILDTWNIDKKRASTTDWGLPGYEEGAIYTHLLNNLGRAIYQEHQYLTGGMDYGWGRDERSGKTAAHFIGYSIGNGIDVYGEYTTNNHTRVKTPDQVVDEVVKFYYEQMKMYCNNVGWASPFNLKVRVDNASVGIIALLNNQARKYKLSWLQFVKCRKFPVNDRIEIVCSAMSRSQLRLGPDVKLLKGEMELSYYEDTETQKRAKDNDHSINAFEYGIEPFMYKIAKDTGLTRLAVKGEAKW